MLPSGTRWALSCHLSSTPSPTPPHSHYDILPYIKPREPAEHDLTALRLCAILNLSTFKVSCFSQVSCVTVMEETSTIFWSLLDMFILQVWVHVAIWCERCWIDTSSGLRQKGGKRFVRRKLTTYKTHTSPLHNSAWRENNRWAEELPASCAGSPRDASVVSHHMQGGHLGGAAVTCSCKSLLAPSLRFVHPAIC